MLRFSRLSGAVVILSALISKTNFETLDSSSLEDQFASLYFYPAMEISKFHVKSNRSTTISRFAHTLFGLSYCGMSRCFSHFMMAKRISKQLSNTEPKAKHRKRLRSGLATVVPQEQPQSATEHQGSMKVI